MTNKPCRCIFLFSIQFNFGKFIQQKNPSNLKITLTKHKQKQLNKFGL